MALSLEKSLCQQGSRAPLLVRVDNFVTQQLGKNEVPSMSTEGTEPKTKFARRPYSSPTLALIPCSSLSRPGVLGVEVYTVAQYLHGSSRTLLPGRLSDGLRYPSTGSFPLGKVHFVEEFPRGR